MIKAYQAVQNAAKTIQTKASSTNALHGGGKNNTFSSMIKDQMTQATNDLQAVDKAVKSFMTRSGSENIFAYSTRNRKNKGQIEVIRSIIDTINKVVNINI